MVIHSKMAVWHDPSLTQQVPHKAILGRDVSRFK
jgi:hypothetical protein